MTAMNLPCRPPARAFAPLLAAVVSLAACGGGGDGGSSGGPTVSSAAITSSAVRYGQTLVITINGSGLDQGLALTSTVCKNAALGTTVPFVSGPTTAFFLCTLSGIGSGDVKLLRASDGATLATIAVVVPVPQVTLSVSNGAGVAGTMVITLAPDKAPITVDNFLSYVNSGFYVGTLFHRVVPGFVVQGGGYVAPLNAAPGTLKPASAPIALEVGTGLSNVQWSIAMARASSNVNSATSQFFVNLVDNSTMLDPGPLTGAGYAVFGSVTLGTSAVTAVVNAPCTSIAGFAGTNGTGECTPIPNMAIVSAVRTQ